jgi:hypothetical protein
MTAVRRIRGPKTELTAIIPDEAVAYLFGPLVETINQHAKDVVAAAAEGCAKATKPPELPEAKLA